MFCVLTKKKKERSTCTMLKPVMRSKPVQKASVKYTFFLLYCSLVVVHQVSEHGLATNSPQNVFVKHKVCSWWRCLADRTGVNWVSWIFSFHGDMSEWISVSKTWKPFGNRPCWNRCKLNDNREYSLNSSLAEVCCRQQCCFEHCRGCGKPCWKLTLA